jgi:hypothetical protein
MKTPIRDGSGFNLMGIMIAVAIVGRLYLIAPPKRIRARQISFTAPASTIAGRENDAQGNPKTADIDSVAGFSR